MISITLLAFFQHSIHTLQCCKCFSTSILFSALFYVEIKFHKEMITIAICTYLHLVVIV